MKTRMMHAARAELANAIRSRYGAATGNAKRRILDEFIAASGPPIALRALDVNNGTEFVNDRLIECFLGHGIELTLATVPQE